MALINKMVGKVMTSIQAKKKKGHDKYYRKNLHIIHYKPRGAHFAADTAHERAQSEFYPELF